jgi:hypothetical protein
MSAVAAEIPSTLDADGSARAGVYALLGALLRDVPSARLLEQVRHLDSATGRDDFALSWEGLRLGARQVRPAELDDELNRRAWTDTIPRFALRPAALDAGRYARFEAFLAQGGLIGEAKPVSEIAIDVGAP